MASAVSAQPAPSPVLERKAKALGLVYKEAVAQPEGSGERRKLYTEFLQDSEALLKEMPNAINIWVLRAAIAIEINNAVVGWQAGQRLLALGADKNPEPSIQDLLVQLERRKWLGEKPPAASSSSIYGAWENSLGMKFVPVPGTRVRFCTWETRVGDYAGFVKATGLNWTPEEGQDSRHPAGNVSWDDAKAFCQWLTAKEKATKTIGPQQFYRLPTDAEWSVAVGLGNEPGDSPSEKHRSTDGVYPWGTDWPPPLDAGNYDFPGDGYEKSAPVGSFPANKFGLFDLGGNVWEWVEDLRGGNGEDKSRHVARGGGFDYPIPSSSRPVILTSSFRHSLRLGQDTFIGFRLVLVGVSPP